jgi:hypothetical protein
VSPAIEGAAAALPGSVDSDIKQRPLPGVGAVFRIANFRERCRNLLASISVRLDGGNGIRAGFAAVWVKYGLEPSVVMCDAHERRRRSHRPGDRGGNMTRAEITLRAACKHDVPTMTNDETAGVFGEIVDFTTRVKYSDRSDTADSDRLDLLESLLDRGLFLVVSKLLSGCLGKRFTFMHCVSFSLSPSRAYFCGT